MAISGLETRNFPLEFRYMPFGPCGKASREGLDLDSQDESESGASPKRAPQRLLKRARSYAGFLPWKLCANTDWHLEESQVGVVQSLQEEKVEVEMEAEVKVKTEVEVGAGPALPVVEGDVQAIGWGVEGPCKADSASASASVPVPVSAPSSGAVITHTHEQDCGHNVLGDGESQCQSHWTTLMIQGIPQFLSLKTCRQKLDASGFAGRYNYLYIPMEDKGESGRNKGFAFLNLVDVETAREFKNKFAGGQLRKRSGWKVTDARLQGLEANLQRAFWAKQNGDKRQLFTLQ